MLATSLAAPSLTNSFRPSSADQRRDEDAINPGHQPGSLEGVRPARLGQATKRRAAWYGPKRLGQATKRPSSELRIIADAAASTLLGVFGVDLDEDRTASSVWCAA